MGHLHHRGGVYPPCNQPIQLEEVGVMMTTGKAIIVAFVITVAMLILGVLLMLVVTSRMSYAENKKPATMRVWLATDNTGKDNTVIGTGR